MITWRGEVLNEWVDYNGHLRDAYYGLIFSYAVDGFMENIGLGAEGRERTGHSLFTLEAHVRYLHEVKLGAAVEVRLQIVAKDKKRLQVYLTLHAADAGADNSQVLAASEQMLLHVDMAGPRAAPFPPALNAQLLAITAEHLRRPAPAYPARALMLG